MTGRHATRLLAFCILAGPASAAVALQDPSERPFPVDPQKSVGDVSPEMKRVEPRRPALERPLFSPNRRPPVVARTEEPVPVTALAPGLTLAGTMLGTARPIAVIKRTSDQKTFMLRVNDQFEDWIVAEIAQHRIVLQNGKSLHFYEILKLKGAP